MPDIVAEIEKLSVMRQKLWADGAHPTEVAKVSKRLENLYEEKRINAAKERTGASRETSRKDWRARIGKQARIESELERLISR